MRTLTAVALIAILDAAALAAPVPDPSPARPAAPGGVLVAGGMGGGGMGGMGGGLRPGGGGGMGGGGMGGGGTGGGGMGGGGMGGGGMGGGGWMGGFGTTHPRLWAQDPAAVDNPDCGRPAAKSKKTKNSRKARRAAPECEAGY